MDTPTLIPIDLITANPYQPRQAEDLQAVAEIAESIRRNGLMQVPTARQVNGHYELAFGHTRLAAFKQNGEECMPLIVRELDDLQMFELGVAENVKRRDLNPIEQAEAMKRYMQEFNKTSVEAGDFFNVSEEQVRGTVRLINLVPEAQAGLAAGKINITAARSLLSMQKIAPREVIVETVKQLEKGVDRHGRQATPDEVIEQAIRHLDESVTMWTDNRDGKPRSTNNYNEPGWLLSNKSFPNKLLPELTPEDIAIALGIQDDQLLIAAANTWAMFRRGHMNQTEDEIDAECVRRGIDQKVMVEIKAKVDHLLAPPACSACPFYVRMDGSHYCGMKTCHTRKTAAWHEHILQQAVNNLRIPLYDKKDGKYQIMTYEHEKLFTARNKDLRLIRKNEVKGQYHYQHFTGVEDAVFLVVMTGKTLEDKTTAVKEARAVVKQSQTSAERRNDLVDGHQTLLEWEATLPVKALLDGLNLAALKALEEAAFDWPADEDDIPEGARLADDATDEVRADHMRRMLAMSMLHEAKGRYLTRGNNCESWALWLCDTLVSWGLKPPKGFVKTAQSFDEQIKEAVTAETGKKNGKGKK
jgi:ParB/RepB/Spo0J family partition protein